MANIRFSCSACGQVLDAPAEYAGAVVECPNCQKEITVPAAGQAPDPAGTGSGCPECGAEMPADSVLCVACGFHKKLGKKITTEFK
jgi:DNA-directed RNA polymerase subunit RPC12/RpoP